MGSLSISFYETAISFCNWKSMLQGCLAFRVVLVPKITQEFNFGPEFLRYLHCRKTSYIPIILISITVLSTTFSVNTLNFQDGAIGAVKGIFTIMEGNCQTHISHFLQLDNQTQPRFFLFWSPQGLRSENDLSFPQDFFWKGRSMVYTDVRKLF